MKLTVTIGFLTAAFCVFVAQPAPADCPLAHTHIGKNPTWRPDWSDPGNPGAATDPDPNDDNKLWLFSLPPVHPSAPTPGWPNWGEPSQEPFLLLVPELDEWGQPIAKPGEPGKNLYTCRFKYGPDGYGDPDGVQHLDGWHSAHGPQGMWNLESIDQQTEPAWDIGIRRESTSLADPTDFFMLRPNDSIVLAADDDTFKFSEYGEKMWLEDHQAWGIHSHMGFYFWLDDPQPTDVFTAAFTAYDDGGMYETSDPFDFRFRVPEPATLLPLLLGLLWLEHGRR
ncbi:MAG: PEP-CTERM sorting domain-containing protein [Phycisphaerae bacterium]|nr:PEP-CTERM sorting domain-containing protein [Phycisphaerae bacterium]